MTSSGTADEAADVAARAWTIFSEMVLAAHHSDGQAAKHAARQAGANGSLLSEASSQVGLYAVPALTKTTLGFEPSRRVLKRTARRLGPKVRSTVVVSNEEIHDVLLAIYLRHRDLSALPVGRFVIVGSAILGCLLDDPNESLRRARDAGVRYVTKALATG